MSRNAALHVLFTVDVESSMGGVWSDESRRPLPSQKRVFCESPAGPLGIPLIVEELRHRDFKATFFCESFGALPLGLDDLRRGTDFLLEFGQDVQLHTHPNFYFYDQYQRTGVRPDANKHHDHLSSHEAEQQRELLNRSKELLKTSTGQTPVAFRAGNYAANVTTLRELARLGFLFDSSLNPAYLVGPLNSRISVPANCVQRIEGVWEFPVTTAQGAFTDLGRLKHLEICALSFPEMRSVLDEASRLGRQSAVIVLHSFGFVKPSDIYYTRLRPDQVSIRRFRLLLDYLRANDDRFRVTTFGELASQDGSVREEQQPFEPRLAHWRGFIRRGVQAVNRLPWV